MLSGLYCSCNAAGLACVPLGVVPSSPGQIDWFDDILPPAEEWVQASSAPCCMGVLTSRVQNAEPRQARGLSRLLGSLCAEDYS